MREKLADQYYLTDSEDEYYPHKNTDGRGAIGASGGEDKEMKPGRTHRRHQPRRYSDMVSSGEEMEEYDEEMEYGRPTSESERRARRQVTSSEQFMHVILNFRN